MSDASEYIVDVDVDGLRLVLEKNVKHRAEAASREFERLKDNKVSLRRVSEGGREECSLPFQRTQSISPLSRSQQVIILTNSNLEGRNIRLQ